MTEITSDNDGSSGINLEEAIYSLEVRDLDHSTKAIPDSTLDETLNITPDGTSSSTLDETLNSTIDDSSQDNEIL